MRKIEHTYCAKDIAAMLESRAKQATEQSDRVVLNCGALLLRCLSDAVAQLALAIDQAPSTSQIVVTVQVDLGPSSLDHEA